jgi:hypothetical protein
LLLVDVSAEVSAESADVSAEVSADLSADVSVLAFYDIHAGSKRHSELMWFHTTDDKCGKRAVGQINTVHDI